MRIEPLINPLDNETQELIDHVFPKEKTSPNLYRILAKNRPLLAHLIATDFFSKKGLFYSTRLADTLREKIILRTSVVCKNEYEYQLHIKTISELMGLTKTQIKDIANANIDEEIWSKSDVALFQLIENLITNIKVSDSLYESLREHFTEDTLLDITSIIGFYTTAAMIAALSKPELDNY